MPIPADWYPHRRGDGEHFGWIIPERDGFRAGDLLADEFGAASAVGVPQERFRLSFPAPEELRPI